MDLSSVRGVVGVDGYNSTVTGDVSMTVTCAASDFHHVPCCITKKTKKTHTRKKEEDGTHERREEDVV